MRAACARSCAGRCPPPRVPRYLGSGCALPAVASVLGVLLLAGAVMRGRASSAVSVGKGGKATLTGCIARGNHAVSAVPR